MWYAEAVAHQLRRGAIPQDVKVDTRLLIVKPLHARWAIAFYRHMQLNAGKKIIQIGFRIAHVREAYEQASQLNQLAIQRNELTHWQRQPHPST